MLVEHDPVEAHLLGIDGFVEVFVVQPRADFTIEKTIGNPEEAAVLDYFVFRNFAVRTLGEIHYMHGVVSFSSRYSPALRPETL